MKGTKQVADQVIEVLEKIPEMKMIAVTIGKPDGEEPNAGTLAITLVDSKKRRFTTTQIKDQIRELLKPFEYVRPAVSDYSAV